MRGMRKILKWQYIGIKNLPPLKDCLCKHIVIIAFTGKYGAESRPCWPVWVTRVLSVFIISWHITLFWNHLQTIFSSRENSIKLLADACRFFLDINPFRTFFFAQVEKGIVCALHEDITNYLELEFDNRINFIDEVGTKN